MAHKALRSGADAIILDLEDAVAFAEKDVARATVGKLLPEIDGQEPRVFVRVNGWQTGHILDDLAAVVGPNLVGVVLPKTETPGDVDSLDRVLGELELRRGLQLGQIEIVPMPETALGMYRLFDIAQASPRILRISGVQFLTPGGDFQRSMGAAWTPDGRHMVPLDSKVVLEARAAGIRHVIGSTGPDLRDLDIVRAIAIRAREAGADSAWVMHPSHVPIVNEIFGTGGAELAEARELVRAFAAALDRGTAIFDWHGQLVDRTHARSALKVLREAAATGIDVGDFPDLQLE